MRGQGVRDKETEMEKRKEGGKEGRVWEWESEGTGSGG